MPADVEAALVQAWSEVLTIVGWALGLIAAGSILFIALCGLIGLVKAGRRTGAQRGTVTRIEAYLEEHCTEALETPRPRAEDVDFVLQYLLAEHLKGSRSPRQLYRD